MKRVVWTSVLGLVVGCGGSQPANTPNVASEPPAAVPGTPSPTVTTTASGGETAKPADSHIKKADDPPGLVLPDSDVDTVGGKPPELPIR